MQVIVIVPFALLVLDNAGRVSWIVGQAEFIVGSVLGIFIYRYLIRKAAGEKQEDYMVTYKNERKFSLVSAIFFLVLGLMGFFLLNYWDWALGLIIISAILIFDVSIMVFFAGSLRKRTQSTKPTFVLIMDVLSRSAQG